MKRILLSALAGLPLVFTATFTTTAPTAHAANEAVEGLPKASEPRVVQLAAPQENTLANGLRVIAMERTGLPLLSAVLVVKSGAESDPPKLAGLADFTAKLLTQGTTTRSATQIAAEVESLGATLAGASTWDSTTVALTTLSAQAAPALAIMADVVRHPKFAPEEITRQRQQTLDDLLLSLEEPGTVARLAATHLLFGAGLYGHPAGGTPASLARFRRADIVSFHAAHFIPAHTQLIVAGALPAAEVFALAEKSFGDWQPATKQQPEDLPKFTPVAKPRAVLIDLPNAGQAAVWVGAPGIARASADYFTGKVADAALGGGYSSRLNQEIRVKRGLSYGASSSLAALQGGGWFSARCQTKNESAADVVKIMQTELARLGTEPIAADYLTSRQAVLTGDFAREFETNATTVTTVASFTRYGLPLEAVNEFTASIQKVTDPEVRAFAGPHFDPAAASVLVVGRAKDCAAPLRALFPQLEVIPQAQLDLDSATLRKPLTTRKRN